mgnify:CR=1 FL=1
MIKSITLQHFKCFKERRTIEFSSVNLLTGENNTGKHTVLCAIMAVKDFLKKEEVSKEGLYVMKSLENYRCNAEPFKDPVVGINIPDPNRLNEELANLYFISPYRGENRGVYDKLPKIEEVLFDKPEHIKKFIGNCDDKTDLRYEGIGYKCVRNITKAMYLAEENSIVMIEYPEIGIHPSVLSKLIDFIIKKSTEKKIQLFIKTNSVYVINELRIAVINELVDNKDVRILDFRREELETPNITEISIDNNGNISYYPDGFMEEYGKQMSKLV